MESSLRRLITKALSSAGADVMPVENTARPGTPDINYCLKGVEGWIELKDEWSKTLRKAQVIWIRNRLKAGGNVIIVYRLEHYSLAVFDPPTCGLWEELARPASRRRISAVHGISMTIEGLADAISRW